MESRAFLAAFAALPAIVADRLGAQLQRTNDRNHDAFEQHGLDAYRKYMAAERGRHDLVILGHVHRPFDTGPGRPRLVVLGGWIEGSAYLKVDGPAVDHITAAPGD